MSETKTKWDSMDRAEKAEAELQRYVSGPNY